jgi:hypothetical protein
MKIDEHKLKATKRWKQKHNIALNPTVEKVQIAVDPQPCLDPDAEEPVDDFGTL